MRSIADDTSVTMSTLVSGSVRCIVYRQRTNPSGPTWYRSEVTQTTIGRNIPTNAYGSLMGDNSVPSEDTPALQDVLAALDDPDCRAILQETVEPMTATELIDICDIPKSTLYRKLELLSSASLVRERERINPGGGRTTHYVRSFDDVTISMDDEGAFAVTVERSPQSTEQRLADIWSMMGDEL